MEAINSLASAATKAIWGENGKDDAVARNSTEEPVSGVRGDVSKGEPFDAGNMENSESVAKSPGDEKSPSEVKPSSNMTGDSTRAQDDIRSPSDPTTSAGTAEAKGNVDNVEPLDPKSLKGPGPKPIAQLAKEHGGDAGNLGRDGSASGSNPAASGVDSPGVTGEAGGERQEAAGSARDADGESKGTGEKYIKSSGVQADGGDFDAANAGAGREADRILEEKGIHTPSNKTPASPDGKTSSKPSSPERKGVKALGQKIKAKLGRGSNS